MRKFDKTKLGLDILMLLLVTISATINKGYWDIVLVILWLIIFGLDIFSAKINKQNN